MKRRVRFSLGKKLAAILVLTGVILSATAIAVSYQTFSRSMTEYYNVMGSSDNRFLCAIIGNDSTNCFFLLRCLLLRFFGSVFLSYNYLLPVYIID